MLQIEQKTRRLVGVMGLGGWLLLAEPVLAQIIPDTTLGNESSAVSPALVRGSAANQIGGGATRGSNLFHSFSEFNVLDGQRVYFANPTGIDRIISRITGSTGSNIFGTLGVDGNANLFLLNPNGIVFGPNAQLDVSGAFFASTGDRLSFSDGSNFSASNPEGSPLSVSVPVGVQYGLATSSTISNRGDLRVGGNFTLAAANLDLQGQLRSGGNLNLRAQNTLQIRDSASTPFVAAANGQLRVQGNGLVDIFALNHPNSGLFSGGDLVVRSPNSVIGDARYTSGGSFRIEQPDGSLGDLISPNDPVIRATGDVTFNSYTGASLHIFAGGSVNIPGFVWIQGADPVNGIVETVTLANGTTVAINGQTTPTLDIRAGIQADNPILQPPSVVGGGTFDPTPPAIGATPTSSNITIGTIFFATPAFDPFGTGGTPIPLAGDVLLTNQYDPNGTPGNITLFPTLGTPATFALFTGQFDRGGRVDIHASGAVELNGTIAAFAPALFGGTAQSGPGGNVNITAQQDIVLQPNALIETSGTIGGNVSLLSNGNIILNPNSVIRSASENIDTTNFSTIRLRTTGGWIRLNQSTINTTNDGTGLAGDVFLIARDNVEIFNGSEISSNGRLGRIIARSNQGSLIIDNSQLTTTNTAETLAGDILLTAQQNVSVQNASRIDARGNFGRIFVGLSSEVPSSIPFSPRRIVISGNSRLTTDNDRTGATSSERAGDISLVALEFIDIVGTGSCPNINACTIVSSDTSNAANAGSIALGSAQINLRGNVEVRTITFGEGNAGNVVLSAIGAIAIADSRVYSTVEPLTTGSSTEIRQGGNIFIDANALTLTNSGLQAQVRGSESGPTVFGNAGEIILDIAGTTTVDNSSILSSLGVDDRPNTEGRGGRILIGNDIVLDSNGNVLSMSPSTALVVLNGSNISASTFGVGDARGVIATADDFLLSGSLTGTGTSFSQIQTAVGTRASGNGGGILLGRSVVRSGSVFESITPARSIVLSNGGALIASTRGGTTGSPSNAGSIIAIADQFSILGATAPNPVDGGTLPSQVRVTVEQNAVGNGGGIILAGGVVFDSNGFFQSFAPAEFLTLTGGGSLTASTAGTGNAGSIFAIANAINLSGATTGRVPSQIRTAVEAQSSQGEGGNVLLGGSFVFNPMGFQLGAANILTLQDGGQLIANTSGFGRAGNIFAAADVLEFSGVDLQQDLASGVFTDVVLRDGAVDEQNRRGGSIFLGSTITLLASGDQSLTQVDPAREIVFTNGGQLVASTSGQGRAGDIYAAGDRIRFTGTSDLTRAGFRYPSAAFSAVNENARRLSGQSANVALGGNIVLSGGITLGANFTLQSLLPAEQVELQDGARLSVSSFGSDILTRDFGALPDFRGGTGQIAGNIAIATRALGVFDRSAIVAETAAGDGGNININTTLLSDDNTIVMGGESLISTTAGTNEAPGVGGNITFNPPNARQGFIIARPRGNNDILSNAFNGAGGRISINGRGIFGFVERSREDLQRIFGIADPPPLSPYSQPPGPLQTNDVTAFSETRPDLSGEININADPTDPTGRAVELPNLRDTPQLNAQCPTTAEQARNLSQFYNTGRGGLPPTLSESTGTEGVVSQLATLEESSESGQERGTALATDEGTASTLIPLNTPDAPTLVEAQGWVVQPDGTVRLVSDTEAGATPDQGAGRHTACEGMGNEG